MNLNLLLKYQEVMLFGIALIFGGVIVAFFVWGTGLLIVNFDAAFATTAIEEAQTDFRSEEARQVLVDRDLL